MINKILKDVHIKCVGTSFELILDDIKNDITILAANDKDRELTYLWTVLPPISKININIGMAFKLLTTLLNIIYKFYNKKRLILGNLAEEIIFFTVIENAKELAKDKNITTEAIDDYADSIFQDTDFLFLYEHKYDGIELTETGEEMGITSLAASEWFKPFNNTKRKPHPVFWEEVDKKNFYHNQ